MSAPLTCDLVIPALNERANIDTLLDELASLRGGTIRRIVLADNGSTDGTGDAALARDVVVVREPRRGYGGACLKALAWIADNGPPDVVAFLDADLADDPAMLPELLAPIERDEAELVIGSRVQHAEPGSLNFSQRFGNRLACTLMSILAGKRYTDLGPFRAVRWATYERLAMADRTWGWTAEMQMKAALAGIPTAEVDVPYRARRGGRSKVSGTLLGIVAAGTKIIGTIVLLWLRGRGNPNATRRE